MAAYSIRRSLIVDELPVDSASGMGKRSVSSYLWN
jgi:hypothetical protein